MKKRVYSQGLFIIILSLFIFGLYVWQYSPKPDFWLIVEYLEAKSAILSAKFINNKSLYFISNSIGIPRLSLPIFLFTPIVLIKTSYPLPLLFVNYIILIACVLVILKNFKYVQKKYLLYLNFLFIMLSPVIFKSLVSSIAVSFTTLLFLIYIFSSKNWLKIISLILACLTSFTSWPLFLFLLISELVISKNKSKVSIKIGLFVVLIIFILNNVGTTNLINNYFPILKAKTQGYYIDIHRQADLVAGLPFLGKVFYNKYIVVLRIIFEESLKYLDWDFLVFHTATGKFTSNPPTFALMTVFELPLFLYGLFLAIRKKIKGLEYLIITIMSLAIYRYSEDLVLIYWLAISYLLLQTWQILIKHSSTKYILLYSVLIIVSKIILINHSESELKLQGRTYEVYEELANYLKSEKLTKPIFITDRLGQPHIYLSFLNVNSLADLRENLSITKRRDAKELLQPDKINNFIFTSFDSHNIDSLVNTNQYEIIIEFKQNFSDINTLKKNHNTHQFEKSLITNIYGKQEPTNLFLLENQ